MAAFEDRRMPERVELFCDCCRRFYLVEKAWVPERYISATCFLCSTAQHPDSCPPERRRHNIARPA